MPRVSLPLGAPVPPECRGGAVTLGNFDGVHLGHQALLAAAVRQARAKGGPAVAVTFSQHPLQLLRPATFEPVLMTLDERVAQLHRYGAEHVVVLETSRELLQLGARAFFEQILVDGLAAHTIVEGFNFGFGKNREGTTETLQSLGREKSVEVVLVPAVEVLGKPVSSSRVRHEVQAGHVAIACTLLGEPFRIEGTVTTGQRRGQSLGFPTANLTDVATLTPGPGVYAVRVPLAERCWPAAANIGANPTFGEQAFKIEIHLIGFEGDLYGQRLRVEFLDKLRDTRPFASVEDLQSQLQRDIEHAHAVNTAISANGATSV